ncbi:hypothetical protein FHG87_024583 [Trinorchestia longiramus]|nr:hypothetical protein FHG87_024583 [Trinorchestia longiramus]
MSFYIIPPTNTGRLEQLMVDVNTRLQLLYLLVQCNRHTSALQQHLQERAFALESDSLIEHTSRDKNSHFLLRWVE